MQITERIVARLRREEDGSLSNQKVEQYALLRAEEVVSETAAWTMIMSSGAGNLPSSGYRTNIHKSPAFKARLEELMEEKAQLEAGGVWTRLEWQSRQCYRKAAAMNDLRGMQLATETLLKIAAHNDAPAKKATSGDDDEDDAPRGRGAPPVEAPQPADGVPNYRRDHLVSRP